MLGNSSVLILLSRIKNSDIGITWDKKIKCNDKVQSLLKEKKIYSKTLKQKHLYYLVSFLLLGVLFKVRFGWITVTFWGVEECLIRTVKSSVLFLELIPWLFPGQNNFRIWCSNRVGSKGTIITFLFWTQNRALKLWSELTFFSLTLCCKIFIADFLTRIIVAETNEILFLKSCLRIGNRMTLYINKPLEALI